MNLARKYRPMIFADVVGQEHVKTIIQNSLRSGNVSHAFLFFGTRGTGKTTLARLVAKAINCENLQNGEPCNACEMCIANNEGRLVDLIEIDAASNRGIDEIRALKEKIGFSPTFAKKKIYIIDEVHMMTKEAFNALLKTLEEPPEHVYFVLATTELHKIPDTIQSRCQVFSFQKFTNDQMTTRLQEICERENIKFDRDALLTVANEAEGGLRDAIFLLEQHSSDGVISSENLARKLGLAPQTALVRFYDHIQNQEIKEAVDLISDIASEGLSLSNFSKSFLSFLRGKMLDALFAKETDKLKSILSIIEIFSNAHLQLKNAVIQSLPLEVAIISLADIETADKPAGWFSFHKKSEAKKTDETKSEEKAIEEKADTIKKEELRIKSEELKVKSAVYEAEEVSVETVEEAWNQVIDKVSSYAIKMALKQGRVSAADNKKVTLAFAAEAFKEKIDDTVGNREVSKAFEEIFKMPIVVDTILDNISLEPVATEEYNGTVSNNKKLTGKELEDAVNEVFGTIKN